MLRFLADECFHGDLVRAMKTRRPDLDVVRVQDVGLDGAHDRDILAWAAEHGRIVLSHDVNTLVGYAHERTRTRQSMPGVVEVSRTLSIQRAVEDVLLLAVCSREDECEGQVIYVPL
jgi:predicted nuclease of predicted toxin-antitoxin system